ncbi:unnamed protein product [Musa acuminata subsp. burmannicoides]
MAADLRGRRRRGESWCLALERNGSRRNTQPPSSHCSTLDGQRTPISH